MGFTDRSGYWRPSPAEDTRDAGRIRLGLMVYLVYLLALTGLWGFAAAGQSDPVLEADLRSGVILLAVLSGGTAVAVLFRARAAQILGYLHAACHVPLFAVAMLMPAPRLATAGAVLFLYGIWTVLYLGLGTGPNARFRGRRRDRRAVPRPSWVYPGRDAARAHPLFRLSPAIRLMAAAFLGLAIFRVSALAEGAGGWRMAMALVFAAIEALAAVGLILKRPFAYPLSLFAAFNGGALVLALALYVGVTAPLMAAMLGAAGLMLLVGGLTYLAEGVRPNLIYRHRYQRADGEG